MNACLEEECFPRSVRKRKKVDRGSQNGEDDDDNDGLHVYLHNKSMKDEVKSLKEDIIQSTQIHFLTIENIEKGMTLVGCVVTIHPDELFIGLPNSLKGIVSATQVSSIYAKAYEKQLSSDAMLPSLSDLFEVNQLVICSIIHVNRTLKQIELTLRPNAVNKKFEKSRAKPGQLICGCIKSIEDHGYIIDIGQDHIHGFMPLSQKDASQELKKFMIVRFAIIEIKNNGKVLVLSNIQHLLTKPMVIADPDDVTVDMLYPSLVVKFIPNETVTGGKIGTVGNITANVSIIHLPSCDTNDDDGDEKDEKLKPPPKKKKQKNAGKNAVSLEDVKFEKKKAKRKICAAMVLYTTPKLVVLTSNVNIWNKTQRMQLCKTYKQKYYVGHRYTAKVLERIPGLGLICRLPKNGPIGLIGMDQLSDDKIEFDEMKNINQLKIRIVDNMSLDFCLELSAKKSIYNIEYMSFGDINPGDNVKAQVLEISNEIGLQVVLGSWQDDKFYPSDFRAIVPVLHMSDIILKHPEKKFKLEDILTCRVLNVNADSELITLTNKQSLVDSTLPIITNYYQLRLNDIVHVYIKAITNLGCLVGLYNNVKGFVPRSELMLLNPDMSIHEEYDVGQVVRARVCACDPSEEKLVMSFRLKIKKNK